MPGISLVQLEFNTIEGITDVRQSMGDEGTLEVKITCRSTADLRGSIYKKIKQTDWILLELYQETQSLEKIFQKLTKEK